MSLHHFPHQAIDGRWHAVYRLPACSTLHSVMDAPNRQAVEGECRRLNAEQARQEAAALAAAVHPADRKIPAGFYTDRDAQ